MSVVAEAEAKARLEFRNSDLKHDPDGGTTNNERMSPLFRVPPLNKGETAVYKLISAEQNDLSRTTLDGKPIKKTASYSMTGIKKIFDPYAKRHITITSGRVQQRKTKTPFGEIVSSRPQPVIFSVQKPAIVVGHDEPELYSFLERADENASNPFRNRRVKARFYRVNSRKKIQDQLELADKKTAAQHWVLREAQYKDLLRCAEQVKVLRPDVNIRTDYENAEASSAYELLKRELWALADRDPETVIKASTKHDAQIKLAIQDAERFQIIMFADGRNVKAAGNVQHRQWFYNDEGLTGIHVLEPGKDKYEGLMEFFLSDKEGQKHFKKITELLKAVLTPRK